MTILLINQKTYRHSPTTFQKHAPSSVANKNGLKLDLFVYGRGGKWDIVSVAVILFIVKMCVICLKLFQLAV
ncbi:hypothetical protein HZ326_20038 [Fusarium oxysporum f. sp. albedinis]|nr:hypothetical protein HZ326_20038 [Fusarium oxysporum f. sp. albedinis]